MVTRVKGFQSSEIATLAEKINTFLETLDGKDPFINRIEYQVVVSTGIQFHYTLMSYDVDMDLNKKVDE